MLGATALVRRCGALTSQARRIWCSHFFMLPDSAHVLAAVKATGRPACIGETAGAALNVPTTAVPGWLAGWARRNWYERCGPRVEEHRPPKADAESREHAERIEARRPKLLETVEAEDARRQLPLMGLTLEQTQGGTLLRYPTRNLGRIARVLTVLDCPFGVRRRQSSSTTSCGRG